MVLRGPRRGCTDVSKGVAYDLVSVTAARWGNCMSVYIAAMSHVQPKVSASLDLRM